MTAARFQPGDRVRARVSTPFVQAGTLGTVVPGYPTMRDACEVYFRFFRTCRKANQGLPHQ
jgi:hypothetical protein